MLVQPGVRQVELGEEGGEVEVLALPNYVYYAKMGGFRTIEHWLVLTDAVAKDAGGNRFGLVAETSETYVGYDPRVRSIERPLPGVAVALVSANAMLRVVFVSAHLGRPGAAARSFEARGDAFAWVHEQLALARAS